MRFAAVMRSFVLGGSAVEASNEVLGAWVRMQSYASSDEVESPRLAGAFTWNERRWLVACQVSTDDAAAVVAAGLARWDGDDMVLEGFDADGLAAIKARREGGKLGGRPPRKTSPKPQVKVRGNLGKTSGEPLSSPLLSFPLPTKAEQEKIPPGGAGKPRDKAADPRAQRFIAIFCEEWRARHGSQYRPGASQRGALLTMLRDYPNLTDDAWRAFCARSQASGRPMELGQLARNLNTVNAGGQRSFLTPQQIAEESMRQFVANGGEK